MTEKYFWRRSRLLRRFPESGFVIMNPNATDDLKFYCSTKTTNTSRTLYWSETADQAKIFDKEVSAKAALRKMSKRNEKYKDFKIVSVESEMIDAFEIDMNTGEIRACKAWPAELNNQAVFKTKLEALHYEMEHKMKEKASYVLHVQKVQKQIEQLDKAIATEVKSKKK